MKSFFPVLLDVEQRPCLVVGGGRVAERKVLRLLQEKALVKLVAPEATTSLVQLAGRGEITWLNREYRTEDGEGSFLVFAATNVAECNDKVATDAKRRGQLVNVVDDLSHCSFTLPSVFQRGMLQISVSTSGASPALAKRVREELEELLGERYSEYTTWLSQFRQTVLKELSDPEQRRYLLQWAGSEGAWQLYLRSGVDALWQEGCNSNIRGLER